MVSAIQARSSRRQLTSVDGLWLAFVAVQVLDGVLTYVGVRTFGLGIEANPLVAWYAEAFGAATGLVAAKLFAIGCASVLYLTSRHRTVAVLTVLYVAFAIVPWAHVLHSYGK
jgi:hypothetical protein